MADKCVVRNTQYKRGGLNKRQRHNERKNADYTNEDIIMERAAFNVHFKQPEGGYESTFDKMVADKIISTHGLGKDPNIVDELVFDVNSAYFENNGGYEYAKSFFEEAYRCAVEEIGGEQYVLSAVMHADERNKALSEQLGRDVYHYHLHVVYVPVVQKELYFKRNNKNPELAGKLKEVITQVSHSKKWPKLKKLDEHGELVKNAKGNTVLVNAYSLLQDHFFQHMRDAGFLGFERGERGSTAEHLTVLEYKSQKETERADAMAAVVEQKQEAAAVLDTVIEGKTQAAAELDEQAAKKKKRLDSLEQKTVLAKREAADFADIDAMPKKTLGGNIQLTPADWLKVSGLAKEGVKSRGIIAGLKKQIDGFVAKVRELTQKLTRYEGMSISDQIKYYDAKKRAPRRLAEIVADIMRKPPEPQEPARTDPARKKTNNMDRS
jgi:hypothetical protein